LYNFVCENDSTTGYFQGLNFVAYYITKVFGSPEWSYSALDYVSDSIYDVRCADDRTTSISVNTSRERA